MTVWKFLKYKLKQNKTDKNPPPTCPRNKTKNSQSHFVTFTNVRSYMPGKEKFCKLLSDSNSDIAIFTKTLLKPAIRDEKRFYSSMNFSVYRCNRPRQRGGGVLVEKKDINCLPFMSSWSNDLELGLFVCLHDSVELFLQRVIDSLVVTVRLFIYCILL